MAQLSPRAQQRLDKYLADVRASLRGCRSIDPRDVERDVLDHIDHELQNRPLPIEEADVEAVLQQLGSPTQWVPEEDVPLWRRLLLTLRRGPEDWRLAYLSFGTFVIALLCLRRNPFLFMIALVVGFLLARAAVAAAEGHQRLGPQRWLFYPSLALVYLPLAFVILFGPTLLAANLANQAWMDSDLSFREAIPLWVCSLTAGGFVGGLWWLILSLILKLAPDLPRHIFYPIVNRIGRKALYSLLFIGAAALSISILLLVMVIPI